MSDKTEEKDISEEEKICITDENLEKISGGVRIGEREYAEENFNDDDFKRGPVKFKIKI